MIYAEVSCAGIEERRAPSGLRNKPMLSPAGKLGLRKEIASCLLPTPWATYTVHGFQDDEVGKEHLALTLGDVSDGEPVLARIHSECLTGDALMSLRCDCGAQLQAAFRQIALEGRGALLYLRQEGRGIGLFNKIRAYALQDCGVDTVEANHQLGFPADLRRYDMCKQMLGHIRVAKLRLMTNNPEKLRALGDLGIQVVEHVPLIVGETSHNERYLATKAERMGHLLRREPLDAGHGRP